MKGLMNISALLAVSILTLSSSTALAHSSDDYDHVETKSLSLQAANLSCFVVEAGAGSLQVVGTSGSLIDVEAEIYQKEKGSSYCLTLKESNNKQAELTANTCHSNNDTRVDLTIKLPYSLLTKITDGSGSINIKDASIQSIVDGSGSIKVANNKVSLTINDGSGSIKVNNLDGDISINDGSGSIKVDSVTGGVSVADGSGSISVSNAGNFKLISDGSGSVNLENVNQDT